VDILYEGVNLMKNHINFSSLPLKISSSIIEEMSESSFKFIPINKINPDFINEVLQEHPNAIRFLPEDKINAYEIISKENADLVHRLITKAIDYRSISMPEILGVYFKKNDEKFREKFMNIIEDNNGLHGPN
jgi:hypothetical protein